MTHHLSLLSPNRPRAGTSLRALAREIIHFALLVQRNYAAASVETARMNIDRFFRQFRTQAEASGYKREQVEMAQYALCAFVDEVVMHSGDKLRKAWESSPLQLQYFSTHLAGEGFYDRIEQMRMMPDSHRDELDLYYNCLQLGFQGRYASDPERIAYYMTMLSKDLRLGDGSAEMRQWHHRAGQRAYVRSYMPLWLFLVLAIGLAFIGKTGFSEAMDIKVEHVRQALGG